MKSISTRSTGCSCGGCGCDSCQGIAVLTPRPTENRPGLAALHYRIGSHGTFLQTMKARLSSLPVPDDATRALAGLRTRDGTDPAIALLDAWATVADVLTFYQERIANEGFLRTATEMRSLFELSRLVGYAPRPGVAASAYLAYTIDANTKQEIVIPKGSRTQTVPGQDERPQSFETSQDLKARAAWNRLGLRKTAPQQWAAIAQTERLFLAGTQTRLKAGDPLLIGHSTLHTRPDAYEVVSVTVDVAKDRTEVRIRPWGQTMSERIPVRSLDDLINDPAVGKIADEVKEMVRRLASGITSRTQLRNALQTLRKHLANVQPPLTATRVRPWLAEVSQTVDALLTDPRISVQSCVEPAPIEERIARLLVPPSKPLDNPMQLPRSLASSFRPGADVAWRALGAVQPALKGTLASAVAGFEDPRILPTVEVWAPRLQTGPFGRLFPRQTRSATDDLDGTGLVTSIVDAGEWPMFFEIDDGVLGCKESVRTLYLDGAREGIAPGTWVFLDTRAVDKLAAAAQVLTMGDGGPPLPQYPTVEPLKPLLVARVETAQKVSRADYGGSGDTTILRLDDCWLNIQTDGKSINIDNLTQRNLNYQVIRRTTVYAQSELLALAETPIEEPLATPSSLGASPDSDREIELDGLYPDLEAGRFAIVSGERADVDQTRGVFASEAVMITSVVHGARFVGDSVHTIITIDKPLAYSYRRDTVSILGNVVKATHGETQAEVLGNGNGAKPLQSFELKQSPLTWLPAATAAGAQSTLNVYVNDVRWREVDSFVGAGANDHVYMVRTDDLGKTTVQFGNGGEGSRLPTGAGNVKALYRSGIGAAGNVLPGQIQQLASRPLGVNEVTNPLRSSGGAERESPSQVRRNAPLAVRSLDRLVSTPDFADFACTFAGIAKADAREISDGNQALLHLTVAGAQDAPLDVDSDLLISLKGALRDLGDPFLPLAVVPRELRLLIVSAKVRIDPDQLWEPVVTRVRNALLEAFGFDRIELAQGIAASQVLGVMQAVPGVSWIDLDAFGAVDTMLTPSGVHRLLTPDELTSAVARVVADGVAPAVQSQRARRDAKSGEILPAQLVLLRAGVPETLVLNQLK